MIRFQLLLNEKNEVSFIKIRYIRVHYKSLQHFILSLIDLNHDALDWFGVID